MAKENRGTGPIEQNNPDMKAFLSQLGFEPGRMLHFQKPLGG